MEQKRQEIILYIIKEEFCEREKLELRFERGISEIEPKLGNKIDNVRSELMTEIEKTKSELIKWMFIFWTGSVITILGGLFEFLKWFLGK